MRRLIYVCISTLQIEVEIAGGNAALPNSVASEKQEEDRVRIQSAGQVACPFDALEVVQ